MFARSALRVTPISSAVARRSFQTSTVRLGSPYHYPEGPRSNIPFNPLTKFFYLRYWGYMGKTGRTADTEEIQLTQL